MVLHLGCILRGGDLRFHCAGIRRELRRVLTGCRGLKQALSQSVGMWRDESRTEM